MPPCFYVDATSTFRIKNAGGHSPALGGPSIRGYRYLYSRSYTLGLLEAFGPNLPKMILLEIAIVPEEDLLGI